LKSNESFMKLQDELAGTENRLATARRDYTLAAQDYNTIAQPLSHGIDCGSDGL